ncbi:CCL5 protein, partial [Leiothrix lutea]|nr:CCL5 protein [Leiothrix lutea]
MKISLALLILLLAAAWTGSQGRSFHSSGARCCAKEEFHHKPIPESRIQDYRYTPSTCTHKAVLVKLRRVKQRWVCVDPQEKWFQDYLKKENESNSTST